MARASISRPARSDARQHLDDLAHRRRAAEDAVRGDLHLVGVELGFVRERQQVAGVGDHRAQFPRHERPWQNVEDAGTKRLERGLRTLWIDDANQHRARAFGANSAGDPERLAAFRAVEQAERGGMIAQFGKRLRGPDGPAKVQAQAAQHRLDGRPVGLRSADPDHDRTEGRGTGGGSCVRCRVREHWRS
jgi:hypothetical protein